MSRPSTQKIGQDEYGRYPFDHPALNGLLNLTAPVKADILDKRRLYGLSDKYGLLQVLRWRPKKVHLPTFSIAFEYVNPYRPIT
jgi:large subunit ribosomal protein L15